MQLTSVRNFTLNFFCFLILLFPSCEKLWAQTDQPLLEQKITLLVENESINTLLSLIEKQITANFVYDPTILEKLSLFSLSLENTTLTSALTKIFEQTSLKYKIIEEQIIITRQKDNKLSDSSESIIEKREKFTISGYIFEEGSQESLIGVNILEVAKGDGTATNVYGFYSMTLPKGTHTLLFSYIGYEPQKKIIDLTKNIELNIHLSSGMELQEVVVIADKSASTFIEGSQMSANKLNLANVKSLPVLMGERDIMKVLQLMPGVQSGTDGSSGLYVRGGGPSQNLTLLDGVPVYNANHLFGFLSTFNGDAVKNVELMKAGYPARYGGRLSSIIDIRMKEGNMEAYQGNVTLGLVSGKFNIEGPIVKDKTSFILSGRRTWLDLITTPIQKGKKDGDQSAVRYNFYDFNLKINHRFSNKSRLYLSAYFGEDLFKDEWDREATKGAFSIGWGNKIGALRWNFQLSPKLFSNTTLIYSKYKYRSNNENRIISSTNPVKATQFETLSNIEDLGFKYDLNFIPLPNHYIRAGFGFTNHQFTPTVNSKIVETTQGAPSVTTVGENQIMANEFFGYVENEMKIGDKISANVGLHFANFNTQHTNYASIQPRLSVGFMLNEKSSIKASYSQMTQYVHLLTSPGLGLPTDLWVPSTAKVKPENSWQLALGYNLDLGKGYQLTLEGYYKRMTNLLEYKSGFSVFSNSEFWEDKVAIGNGLSYGGEILLEKKTGKMTGWIGYTISKSERTFENVNFGETFPYKYDRRHDLGLTLMHKISDRIDLGLIWIYGTGNTYTLGTESYLAIDATDNIDTDLLGGLGTVSYVKGRNNNRTPAYHRLDFSVNLHKQKRFGKRTWSFGVYNIYNRLNPFYMYQDTSKEGKLILKKLSVLPVIPFFSYSFDFNIPKK